MKIPLKNMLFKIKTSDCKVPATRDLSLICKAIEVNAIGLSKQEALSVKKSDEKGIKEKARKAKDVAKELDKFIVKMASKVNKKRDKKEDFLSINGEPRMLCKYLGEKDKKKYENLYKELVDNYGEIGTLIETFMTCYNGQGKMIRTVLSKNFKYGCDFDKCLRVLDPNQK